MPLSVDKISVTYRAGVRPLPAWAMARLKSYMAKYSIPSCAISSTVRTMEEQANAMYTNAEANLARERQLYGSGGNKVLDAYESGKRLGASKGQIISEMVKTMRLNGPENVSKHIETDPPQDEAIFDIAPSSVNPLQHPVLIGMFTEGKSKHEVGEFYFPPQDASFHVEFIPSSADKAAAGPKKSFTDPTGPLGVLGVLLMAYWIFRR